MSKDTAAAKTETATATETKTALPAGFKVAKLVTLPLSKWKNEQPKFLQPESAIFEGKELSVNKGKTEEKPADLMNCIDLATGEQVQVIVGAVLKSTLTEEYPGDSYVGKAFQITQHRDPGKKYNTYSIAELTKA